MRDVHLRDRDDEAKLPAVDATIRNDGTVILVFTAEHASYSVKLWGFEVPTGERDCGSYLSLDISNVHRAALRTKLWANGVEMQRLPDSRLTSLIGEDATFTSVFVEPNDA